MEECNDNKYYFQLTWDANEEKPRTAWEDGSEIGGGSVHFPLNKGETSS